MTSLGRLSFRRIPLIFGRRVFGGANPGVNARGLASSAYRLSSAAPLLRPEFERDGGQGKWGSGSWNYWRGPLAGLGVAGGLAASSLFSKPLWAEEEEKKGPQEVKEEGEKGKEGGEEGKESGQEEEKEKKKKKDGDEEFDYVVIGGGVAAYQAIKTIRQYDKKGTILCVSGEEEFPYNHTILPQRVETV